MVHADVRAAAAVAQAGAGDRGRGAGGYARREPPLPVTVRDRLGELFPDAEFAAGFGVRGRPGWSPSGLALVTVLQMAENLTDRQAAEAVRDKISWKYCVGSGARRCGVRRLGALARAGRRRPGTAGGSGGSARSGGAVPGPASTKPQSPRLGTSTW